MPFPMKVQPLEAAAAADRRSDLTAKPPAGGSKSRLKRLFERQLLRISSSEKLAGDAAPETEPSSVCLDRMIQSFIEDSSSSSNNNNEKARWCGRRRSNCFNGNCDDDSANDDDDEFSAADIIMGLAVCASVTERNLLADAARIVAGGGKEREAVAEGLRAMGYDAGVCRSRWEKTAGYPAGEYEYVDVLIAGVRGGERLLVDVDFRSEFEIARSTKRYRVVLQALPAVFVGKGDRLQQIVAVASEAARQSLTKKGLSFPPWRKAEYMRAKWLSAYHRRVPAAPCPTGEVEMDVMAEEAAVPAWRPPAVRPKAAGARVVTGLASVLRERP